MTVHLEAYVICNTRVYHLVFQSLTIGWSIENETGAILEMFNYPKEKRWYSDFYFDAGDIVTPKMEMVLRWHTTLKILSDAPF